MGRSWSGGRDGLTVAGQRCGAATVRQRLHGDEDFSSFPPLATPGWRAATMDVDVVGLALGLLVAGLRSCVVALSLCLWLQREGRGLTAWAGGQGAGAEGVHVAFYEAAGRVNS
jgi:hypothetical protein